MWSSGSICASGSMSFALKPLSFEARRCAGCPMNNWRTRSGRRDGCSTTCGLSDSTRAWWRVQAGAVVVSTPQDIALIDAKKGIDMFRRMDVPILGIVENMAAFVCDGCGKVHHPFGHGGARAEAERIGAPFLGEVPLYLAIRTAGDGGAPVVAAKPEGEEARPFWAIADGLIATLEARE